MNHICALETGGPLSISHLAQTPFHSQPGIRERMLLCSERQWEPMECRNISYGKMQSVDYQETLFAQKRS